MGADLSHADLSGADLRGAYLIGACLKAALLSDVWLRGALYIGCTLDDVICDGVYWDKTRHVKTLYRPGEFTQLLASSAMHTCDPARCMPLAPVSEPAMHPLSSTLADMLVEHENTFEVWCRSVRYF